MIIITGTSFASLTVKILDNVPLGSRLAYKFCRVSLASPCCAEKKYERTLLAG
jgi:hypothetical protein